MGGEREMESKRQMASQAGPRRLRSGVREGISLGLQCKRPLCRVEGRLQENTGGEEGPVGWWQWSRQQMMVVWTRVVAAEMERKGRIPDAFWRKR